MHLTRFADAKAYDAQGHFDMRMLRLQGRDAGPSESLWIGVSHLLPGGRTTLEASPQEKFYVALEGEVTISNGADSVTLEPWDSCRIAPNEKRELRNDANRPATVLLAMPLPSKE